MSQPRGIVLNMEILYLGIGLLVGALVGYLVASLLRSRGGDKSLDVKIAALEATNSGLLAQLERAEADRKEREEREREKRIDS